MTRLRVLSCIIDSAKTRPSRPLSEVFQRPKLPIREVYWYRFNINIVWFARNYLNLLFLWLLLGCIWLPYCLFPLVVALPLHLVQKEHRRRILSLKLLQVATTALVIWQHGVLRPVFLFVSCMVLISAHALLTAFDDESSEYYDKVVTERGEVVQAPSTPVVHLAAKEVAFPAMVLEGGQVDGSGTFSSAHQVGTKRTGKLVHRAFDEERFTSVAPVG